jgi:uncharacterized protein (DUF433 family)
MDWSECPDVEREEGKVSGAWVVKGSRVSADAVVENARDGFPAEAVAAIFEGLSVKRVRAVLRFAERHAPAS